MTIPAGVATVTVTGTIGGGGVAAVGWIEFAPEVPVSYVGPAWVNSLAPFSVTLTGEAAWSLDMPANDDPAGNPENWTYRVTEHFGGGRALPFYIAVLSANGSTQDYSSIVPVSPSSGVSTTPGPQGIQGPPGGTMTGLWADTDGTPYFDMSGSGTAYTLQPDTDAVPYFA